MILSEQDWKDLPLAVRVAGKDSPQVKGIFALLTGIFLMMYWYYGADYITTLGDNE